MSKQQFLKELKGLDWHKHFFTPLYNGAVHSYQSVEGKTVAVLFTSDKAQIISDDQGLFSAGDIVTYVIKAKDVNHMREEIEQGTVIATSFYLTDEEDSEVGVTFDDSTLTKYGLNSPEIKESLEVRLKLIEGYTTHLGMELM